MSPHVYNPLGFGREVAFSMDMAVEMACLDVQLALHVGFPIAKSLLVIALFRIR